MKRVCWVVVAMLAFGSMAAAQDEPTNPEELKRKYQELQVQLKTAQDRKNELATENEKLTAQVADQEKQLDALRRDAATFAEQTYRLRAQYAAWQAFLARYPILSEKWKLFIERDPLSMPRDLPVMDEPATTGAG